MIGVRSPISLKHFQELLLIFARHLLLLRYKVLPNSLSIDFHEKEAVSKHANLGNVLLFTWLHHCSNSLHPAINIRKIEFVGDISSRSCMEMMLFFVLFFVKNC